MNRRPASFCVAWGILVGAGILHAGLSLSSRGAEAFQVGPDRVHELPDGKEADGIIGDFLLRNDLVEAVIAHDGPHRRPNMTLYYGDDATPGALYDLTLRGRHNDQLTLFAPSNLRGVLSHVRIVKDGTEGEAVVEAFVAAALNNGLSVRHQYVLRDGWQGLLIVTTVHNEANAARPFTTRDEWRTFKRSMTVNTTTVGDASNPVDRCAYAYRWMEGGTWMVPGDEIQVGPGETISMARGLAVADSPAAAYGILASTAEGTAPVSGSLRDERGLAVTTARVEFSIGDTVLPAYPDARGAFRFPLPFGEYAVTVSDTGRAPVKTQLQVQPDAAARIELDLGPVSRVVFDVRNEAGRSIPCKAQFLGTNGTASPNLGPLDRAHGCGDQYHSERGDFAVPVPPGEYHVVVTRGPEFNHLSRSLRIPPGTSVPFEGILRRVVDTRGWISADFHSHSTPSGDTTCSTDDRLINLAAEHIEFAPATEHNRLYDWAPHLERLGLTNEVSTVAGIELTGPGAHLNAFPFQPVPRTQDGGAPRWQKDPRANAIVLRDFQGPRPERWVQVNHPDLIQNFVDRDGDGLADNGYIGLTPLVDGAETSGPDILADSPYRIIRAPNGAEVVAQQREFIWLQLLNRGHRLVCVAVSDAHGVHGDGVGGWRTYLPSSTDQPAEIDWRELTRHAKAGRTMVTTGPFLEVTADDGTTPGGTIRSQGPVRLRVRVQCTDWLDIDRIQVLVNGRKRTDLNFTRTSHPDWFKDGIVKFDREIPVPLSEDAHLVVVAIGEGFSLKTGFGSSAQAALKPCAYHDPILVDVDGGGFTPNGDTLGWELPVRRLQVDEVKRMMAERARH